MVGSWLEVGDFDLTCSTVIRNAVGTEKSAPQNHAMPLIALCEFHARERLKEEAFKRRNVKSSSVDKGGRPPTYTDHLTLVGGLKA